MLNLRTPMRGAQTGVVLYESTYDEFIVLEYVGQSDERNSMHILRESTIFENKRISQPIIIQR